VQEAAPADEERPLPGRHRAAPSRIRRAALAVSAGAAAVIMAGVLGVWAAGDLARTATATADWPAGPRPSAPGQAGPTHRPGATPEGLPVDPLPESPAADSATVPEPLPIPTDLAPSSPSPAPVPTVRPGASCPAEGGTGITKTGTPAVCAASQGNGRPRWRRA